MRTFLALLLCLNRALSGPTTTTTNSSSPSTKFQPKVNPMPKPANSTWSDKGMKPLAEIVQFSTNDTSELLGDAWDRAYRSIVDLRWTPAGVEGPVPSYEPEPHYNFSTLQKRSDLPVLTKVQANVASEAELQQGVDESYVLSIEADSDTVLISANTVWGAMHALTTFQQLVIANDEGTGSSGLIVEGPVIIEDKPLFPYRGLMLDSGRNFLSIKKIKEQIDGMALSKMNVLHWHLSDTTSWPMLLSTYPEMAKDAYGSRDIYTTAAIRDLVAYARARGVRIIPELDMPAHAAAGWKQVDPGIVACADTYWVDTAGEPSPGQLEILNNNTYEVVRNVRKELMGLFPEHIQHIGGDEINTGCYNYSHSIQEWFAEDTSRDYSDLLQYWVDRMVPTIQSLRNGTRIMMWEDIVDAATAAKELPKDVILQIWLGSQETIKNLTSAGFDVVFSSSDFFYLDCGFGGFMTNDPQYDYLSNPEPGNLTSNYGGTGGSSCTYKSWQRIMVPDITDNLTQAEKDHVLGGSVNLWSEQVDDAVVSVKVWPRAAAFAELMWSGNKDPATGQKRISEVAERIFNFREYLLANGILSSPLAPKYCMLYPHSCDASLNQSIIT